MAPKKTTENTSKEYKKLLLKRDNLVRSILSHAEKMKEGTTPNMAATRMKQLEGTHEKYEAIIEKIEDHDDYDPDHLEVDSEDVTEAFIKAIGLIKDALGENSNDTISLSSTMATRSITTTSEVKLPTISIPKFDGSKALEWTTFYDTFSSLVDQNEKIPKISKMHYLRDSLKGEAFRSISKLPASDVNYEIAWKILQEQYHNKRAIVNNCLKSFIFQDSIKTQNASSIRNLIDTTKESLQCIESLDVSIDDWDPFIVYVLQTKLDRDTAIDWEKKLSGSKEIPEYSTMLEFLETQYRIMKAPIEMSCNSQAISQKVHSTRVPNTSNKKDVCEVCKGEHYVLFCDTFNAWNVTQRKQFVTDKGLCVVCMKKHEMENCKSKFRCKKCNGLHSTKLHEDEASASQRVATINDLSTSNQKLLATAIVKVQDKFGTYHMFHALIDQGSQGIIVSENAVQTLCLPRKKEQIPLIGLDDKPLGKATKSVRLQVKSAVDESFVISMEALVMRSIMSGCPQFAKKTNNWKHLKGLNLADPHFMDTNKVDILLGVDIYGIILQSGIRKGKINEPVAQNTALGWLVFGAACNEKDYSVRIHTTRFSTEHNENVKSNDDDDLNTALKRFWENEEVQMKPIMTEEHEKCVEMCKASTVRLPDGQLQVSLPFNMDRNDENFLGDSRKMALRRFFHLEKKFERDQTYYERYKADMLSYLQCNHMNLSKTPLNEGYYVPHHAVTREESTTTKQRTVFDASAKTSNGFSLNDRCLNGPTIQPELFDIFTRWRTHKIALVADIEKMYRQVSLAPEDRKYQKNLWRFSKEEPIQTYEINRVMFGGKAAPYLAINATFHLADTEKERFPRASECVKTCLYVDDCMGGSHSIESAIELQRELNGLFNAGHMHLRKWASNSEKALEGIAIEDRALSPSLVLKTDEMVKTLGMKWTPSTDLLSFTIDMSRLSSDAQITKRTLASDACKLYDPLGLLAPLTIKAKIIMQRTFKEKIGWDDFVDALTQTEWNEYRNELSLIQKIKIDRWLKLQPNSKIKLHGFSDASDNAFSACIYIVQTSNGITTAFLVCAKTRVAPIDPVPTPRLELCGAVLLANLAHRIENNLKIKKNDVHLWTDSSAVWHWLQHHPSRFHVFVAHRVLEIQKLYPAKHWRHVRTHENPADLASRGAFAHQLINNSLWFFGPKWLILDKEHWPKINLSIPPEINLEEKRTKVNVTIPTAKPSEMSFILRFSGLTRLLRITARLLRVINRYRKGDCVMPDYVTADEHQNAKMVLVRHTQSVYFAREIADLQRNGFVNEKSTLRSLNPKLDENGILIVDGRLRYSTLPERQRFPMILPAECHLSKLIIDSAHIKTLHGTIQLTLAHVRHEFWILNARNMVKSTVHKCIDCYRQKPKPMRQLMAPLPTIKTSPSRAFLHCGLDFAGPIEIKSSSKRNSPSEKAYICVFVCMASKAAHVELVGDLSTQKFILAIRRMMARRGIVSDFYCDRGTNFQGAKNELPRLFLEAKSTVSNEIAKLFASDGTRFHFNPPYAPNWGGQWESFVKLTKHHFRRTTTSIKLTFEEMTTLLAQIEACLNSRPLCAITTDIDDLNPLTPGHLLIGTPLNLIPEPSLLTLNDNTLDRFQAIQKGVQNFWKRFYIEYLHAQHPRKKWYKAQKDISIGDLVVVIDDNLPPAKWKMARVTRIFESTDGYIRSATLKTADTEMTRPIVKL
ncbi:uncharacterized protein LOC129572976, partial [Sitodiplosis mosellana]|uniref:uncharacterized protein LOC129572976 n=1 Tax=Sitodiplosis mosellana TaxID=263140 RepID=UPI0024438298